MSPPRLRVRITKMLEATAYHEAGHAVAAWLVGMKFREVSIVPNASQGSLGHILHDRMPRWFNPELMATLRVADRCEKHAVVSLAGPAAEARFRGRHNRQGAGGDWSQALDMVHYLSGSLEEEAAYLNLIRVRARGLVEAHWTKVGAVAAALLERKRLDHAEVAALLRPRRLDPAAVAALVASARVAVHPPS